jgi:hypothetical protein
MSRLAMCGSHTAPFSNHPDSISLADAYYNGFYNETEEGELLIGLDRDEFINILCSKKIVWAPDGDGAFDDGSHILQFDFGTQVRLIGFRANDECEVERSSIAEIWVDAHEYYSVLSSWLGWFDREGSASSKIQRWR